MTLPVVVPPGPSSSNELGNQQGPTSSREVPPLTTSLSSSLTLPASEQILATPTTNQSSTEPRFPANQTIPKVTTVTLNLIVFVQLLKAVDQCTLAHMKYERPHDGDMCEIQISSSI